MNDIRNEFVVNDNYLVIIEYSSVDDDVEETVCDCKLNSIDDVFIVIKRILKCNNIIEYEKILEALRYLTYEYDNIELEVDSVVNQKDYDPY